MAFVEIPTFLCTTHLKEIDSIMSTGPGQQKEMVDESEHFSPYRQDGKLVSLCSRI